MRETKYINHPDIINLCAKCARDTCPSEGCNTYKDKIRELRAAEAEKRAKEKPADYVPRKTPQLLKDVCAVIDALETLSANKDCNAVYPYVKIVRLCHEIKMARFNAYDCDIDWQIIVNSMEGKNND